MVRQEGERLVAYPFYSIPHKTLGENLLTIRFIATRIYTVPRLEVSIRLGPCIYNMFSVVGRQGSSEGTSIQSRRKICSGCTATSPRESSSFG